MVAEGRDTATVVFPDALTFFLTASVRERARRRFRQTQSLDLQKIEAEIAARDHRDANRDVAPMKPADDAEIIDTEGKTPDELVSLLADRVREKAQP